MSNAHEKSHPQIVVYKPKGVRATMRSSYKSWFIGTLFEHDRFFHVPGTETKLGYIWGYANHKYGPYHGRGWVEVDGLERISEPLPHLSAEIIHELHNPISWRGIHFIHRYARHPYPPEFTSHHTKDGHELNPGGAHGHVSIKPGHTVSFYGNYDFSKGTHMGRTHPQHPILQHGDDVRPRYVVRTNPNLLVVDYYRPGSPGIWGVILKVGDNFTFKMV